MRYLPVLAAPAAGAILTLAAVACGDETPAPGPTMYCIVPGHAARQAIGPDPKPSDPHDVPRRVCTADDLSGTPKP